MTPTDRAREGKAVSEPRVVHCKRERFDVYIGRPSKWGNPVRLFNPKDDAARLMVLIEYRDWINGDEVLRNKYGKPPSKVEIREALRGKVLGCWCAPKACHGDVLLEIANADSKRKESHD